MGISVEFTSRIIGAFIAAVAGGVLGNSLADLFNAEAETYVVVMSLVGVLAGLIVTPYVTVRPLRRIRRALSEMSPGRLTAMVGGAFLGQAGPISWREP